MSDEWEDHARTELGPKMASSAYVMTIDPASEIDPKIALETGYAVLLGKPIILIVRAGLEPTPGLERIAHTVVRLTEPLDSMASQIAITSALKAMP